MSKIKGILSVTFTALLVIAAAVGILCFPTASTQGARNGLQFCGEILIPSIFPFMVLSSFVVKSGLSGRMGRALSPITQTLFHLPGSTGATILIGMIGGYPSGARGVKALIERGEISEKQGARMLCFAVGAGPAFVISAVGGGLLHSGRAGVLLFLSQITAALLIGILAGLPYRKEKNVCQAPPKKAATSDFSTALVYSTSDSAAGMLSMCAFVILFSALISILQESGAGEALTLLLTRCGVPPAAAQSLLYILLEVTGGCSEAARAGASPALISFALGWAGVCVHFQIAASLHSFHFSRAKFTLFRLAHGLLAALGSAVLFRFFPQEQEVFSNLSKPAGAALATDPTGSVMLLAVCALFLFTLSAQKVDFRRKKC